MLLSSLLIMGRAVVLALEEETEIIRLNQGLLLHPSGCKQVYGGAGRGGAVPN